MKKVSFTTLESSTSERSSLSRSQSFSFLICSIMDLSEPLPFPWSAVSADTRSTPSLSETGRPLQPAALTSAWGESALLIASKREPTFQNLSRKLMQSSSMLRLTCKHLYPPLTTPHPPPSLALPSLAVYFFFFFNFGWMSDPSESPSNTSYTALPKKETNIPLSFWQKIHCSASQRLQKAFQYSCKNSLAGAVSRDGSLTDGPIKPHLLAKIATEDILDIDRLCWNLVQRCKDDHPRFRGTSLPPFPPFFCNHTTMFLTGRRGAQCRLFTSRGWTKLWKEPLDITKPTWPPLPPPPLFHSVKNNSSHYIHGYSGNLSRMVCKPTVRRGRDKLQRADLQEENVPIQFFLKTKWWNISSFLQNYSLILFLFHKCFMVSQWGEVTLPHNAKAYILRPGHM